MIVQFSGSLKEQSFGEVLLDVANKKGTGVLTFTSKRKKVEIDWVNGRIVHVVQKPAPTSGTLGELLVEIGEITPNQLSQAIVQQRRSLSPLGQILIKLFRCDPMQIRQALRVQAIETLYELFSWLDAEFQFAYGLIDRKGNHFDPIEVNQFLREAIPALEVWSEVRKTLSSPHIKLQSVGSSLPDDDHFPAAVHKVFTALQLKEERTFRELAIVTGLGQFVVGQCVLMLLGERLIFLREAEEKSKPWGRLILGGSALDFAVWVLTMALLVGAGTYLLAFAPYSPLRMLNPRHRYRVEDPRWPQQVDAWRFRQIESALKLYRTVKGQYPEKLETLSEQGWIQSSVLMAPNGTPYTYRRRHSLKYDLGPALHSMTPQ